MVQGLITGVDLRVKLLGLLEFRIQAHSGLFLCCGGWEVVHELRNLCMGCS